MKPIRACLLVCLFAAAALAAPVLPIRLDIQEPQREFSQKFAAGSSPTLRAFVYDGGTVYTDLAGWTGYVFYAVNATQGVYISSSGSASNYVDFYCSPAQTATTGTFTAQVVLSDGTNLLEWGRGSLVLRSSPGTMNASNIPLTGIFNWDLFSFVGTPPPMTAVATNELDPVAMAALAAFTPTDATARAWAAGASNLAASAAAASTDATARAWAIGASNLAASAAAASTDSTARAWAVAASNLAVSAQWVTGEVKRAIAFTAPHPGSTGYTKSSNDLAAISAYLQNVGYGNYLHYGLLDLWTLSPGYTAWWGRLVAGSNGFTRVYNDGGDYGVLWDSANDGAGSGLDADLLDGIHAASFQTVASALTNYWRRTTAVPTNSAFAGEDGQMAVAPRDSTSVWINVYSGTNGWYRWAASQF